MKCPGCGRSGLVDLSVQDSVTCECGREIIIGYYICNACGFAFRTTNGKYVDGYYIDNEVVSKVCDDLSVRINVEDGDDGALSDYVQRCVRCDQTFISEPTDTKFECPHCGFEWEVIKSD